MSILNSYFDNSKSISSFRLKNLLFVEGLKERRCEICKIDSWNGSPAPLELHHINGKSLDNSLNNLQILCPNCHSLTPNFRANNKPRSSKLNKSDEEFISAIQDSCCARQALLKLDLAPYGGSYKRINKIKEKYQINFREKTQEEIDKHRENILRAVDASKKTRFKFVNPNKKRTLAEFHVELRRVERPNKEELLEMIWKKSLSEIAREYSLTSNAIKKWVVLYNIPNPPVGWWAKYKNGYKEYCEEIRLQMFRDYGLDRPEETCTPIPFREYNDF